MSKKKTASNSDMPESFTSRLGIIFSFFAVFALALCVRLSYLQISQHDILSAQSEKQYQLTVKIDYGRGQILDRNGTPLATNLETESIYASPQIIFDKEKTAQALSKSLGLDLASLRKKISSKKQFVWIKRKCTFAEAENVRQLGLAGINFVMEHKRFYPKRELASSVIGFVGMDNQGLSGVELRHHSYLKGFTQLKIMEKDARGRSVSSFDSANANKGSRDVRLTIDEVIQFTTELHLREQVEKFHAKSGFAVVMDPYSGEILALANIPGFNPNQYMSYKPSTWTNHVVSSSYEPGSIFKPIVASAILDKGMIQPEETFFCENGSFKFGRTYIREAANHRFGDLSLKEIIAKSSNIGSVKVAQKLGEENFYDYIKRFGFGEKTGVDLPGESGGQLKSLEEWSQRSIASISFGQEIGVTPLQMVSALSAIANGGRLMQPKIAQAIMKDGKEIKVFPSRAIKRAISPKASKKMTDILKSAVKDGTGKNAILEGYDVAGKTGTAQKMDPETKSYSETGYIASFIGFVPAESPRLAILVMIDEPKEKHWGGTVAAPVFHKIAKQVLRYLNVPSSKEQVFILDRA
ncbi:MAG: penicillin-binding protein [Nitrospinae bacterium CG11_big_fil_rev_8_21_14_0_20_45_15]|nr:MAG: penicillin-binding protein [Nitrospinae bacterium CG11_big_fil_rev_8_21_14_0_20_45_15]